MTKNKYIRDIVSFDGTKSIQVDVYQVLLAFGVTCPARQHAIKKLLCAGLRGKGSTLQDLAETKAAVSRAIDLELQRVLVDFSGVDLRSSVDFSGGGQAVAEYAQQSNWTTGDAQTPPIYYGPPKQEKPKEKPRWQVRCKFDKDIPVGREVYWSKPVQIKADLPSNKFHYIVAHTFYGKGKAVSTLARNLADMLNEV